MNDLNEFLERLQLEEFTLCNHLFRVALLEGEKHHKYKHQFVSDCKSSTLVHRAKALMISYQYTKHCGPDCKPFNPRVHHRTAPFFPVVFSFKIKEHFTLMQSSAACLASWFSVDGPLCPDCSAPLNVNQLTKLNTADSPLAEKKTVNSCNFHQCNQVKI